MNQQVNRHPGADRDLVVTCGSRLETAELSTDAISTFAHPAQSHQTHSMRSARPVILPTQPATKDILRSAGFTRAMIETQLRAGITPALLRLSVGIEDVADLVADLGQALA